jgi:hypothetical protein
MEQATSSSQAPQTHPTTVQVRYGVQMSWLLAPAGHPLGAPPGFEQKALRLSNSLRAEGWEGEEPSALPPLAPPDPRKIQPVLYKLHFVLCF